MRRLFCAIGILLAALLVIAPANAAVKPNSLFSDNAVLQRGIAVPVWGTADPGEEVAVSIADQTASAKADKDGKWMVRLKPLKAGGPFTMTISGLEIKNVLVGEVWIASGQSNMAFSLKNAEGAEAVIAACKDPQLRFAGVPRKPSDEPISDAGVKWVECTPDSATTFSAVAYFFAHDLRKALNVPVAIISTSVGGTPVEAWTASRITETYEQPAVAPRVLTEQQIQNAKNQRKSVLYNGIIAPLIPYAIRGVIWYQGENNANFPHPEWYAQRFPAMIRNWREDWGQGDFPFLFVQLAPFKAIVTEPQESNWAVLRETQLVTSQTVPNTAMAVITDCGDPKNIHPTRKQPVGERLALAARAIAYGEKIPFKGPELKSAIRKDNQMVLEFDPNGGSLVVKGDQLTGFTMSYDDHVFHNATATVSGNKVIVTCPELNRPLAVRYGWADCPIVNLYNSAGLPASPFRTDKFPTTPPTKAANQ